MLLLKDWPKIIVYGRFVIIPHLFPTCTCDVVKNIKITFEEEEAVVVDASAAAVVVVVVVEVGEV